MSLSHCESGRQCVEIANPYIFLFLNQAFVQHDSSRYVIFLERTWTGCRGLNLLRPIGVKIRMDVFSMMTVQNGSTGGMSDGVSAFVCRREVTGLVSGRHRVTALFKPVRPYLIHSYLDAYGALIYYAPGYQLTNSRGYEGVIN